MDPAIEQSESAGPQHPRRVLRSPRAPRPKNQGPSVILSVLFVVLLAGIVIPLVGFVAAITVGSQGGILFFSKALTWTLGIVAAFLLYGFAVGVYHVFLAVTGLDGGKAKSHE